MYILYIILILVNTDNGYIKERIKRLTNNKRSSDTTLLRHIRYSTKILKNATVQTRFCTSR